MKLPEHAKFLVIGLPARHSKSPVMQNAAFEFYRQGSPYGFLELTLEELPEFVSLAKKQLLGFNITAPYKQAIMPFCATISDEARAAESVNTVKVENGELAGFTTDGFGFVSALRNALNIDPRGGKFLILGAGGAAGAIARTMALEAAAEIFVANRTLAKAEALAEKVGGTPVALDAIFPLLGAVDCVVNCTSLGLKADDPSPLTAEQVAACRAVFDTVYLPTKLQKLAMEKRVKCANGSLMLLYQGAKSFEIWTGKPAPVEAMKDALLRALEA